MNLLTDATSRSSTERHVHVLVVSFRCLGEAIWIVLHGVGEELLVAMNAKQRDDYRHSFLNCVL
jgi:hypothetical protein